MVAVHRNTHCIIALTLALVLALSLSMSLSRRDMDMMLCNEEKLELDKCTMY